MLRPTEYQSQRQAETDVALQIVKDAAKEDIPLCADVEQTRTGPPNIVVRHYDHGKELSLSELRIIQEICKVAARKKEFKLHYTLESLRYSIEPMPKREHQPDPQELEHKRRALERYIRLCEPFHYLRKEANDILAPWRYLKWPVNCHCK